MDKPKLLLKITGNKKEYKKFEESLRTEGRQEIKELLVTNFKKFNGLIKTEEDVLSFVDRIVRCSDCHREFYDKRCPSCIKPFEKLAKKDIIQDVLKIIKENTDSLGYIYAEDIKKKIMELQ
jgi:hypothetical protein